MRNPFTPEAYGGEDVRIRNAFSFEDVLACSENAPENKD